MRVSAKSVSFGVIAILMSSACADTNSPSNHGSGDNTSVHTAPFDLCEDIVADFYTKYRFDYPPTPTTHGFVVGPNKGQGCRFNTERAYDVIIEMTDDPVELGTASEYNKLVYESYVIRGRPAEIARAQNQTDVGGSYVSSESCDLNVELPDHMVTFFFSNSGLSDDAPEPCEKLTEIATDVIKMMQSAG